MKSRRFLSILGAAALAASLAACASPAAESPEVDKKIVVGFNAGPYQQQFEEGIAPLLEADGYEVESKEFSDGVQVNVALGQKQIDANIMQHQSYLDFINAQENLTGVALVQVPTPPMGLYGGKKTSLDAIAEGDTVSLPNQPSNLYRALLVLQDAGWITVSDAIEPGTAALKDVASNPKNLDLILMDNAQQARALPDVAYAVIQGNFAVSSGMKLTDALALEKLQDAFAVIVTVDESQKDAEWAKAIDKAYRSPEFATYIASQDVYAGYKLPAFLPSAK